MKSVFGIFGCRRGRNDAAAQIKGKDGKGIKAYLKTYYTEKDFTDSRYDPAFSPILYPGQRVSVWLRPEDGRKDQQARLWAADGQGKMICEGQWAALPDGQWCCLQLMLNCDPALVIHRVGVEIEGASSPVCYLDDMHFDGKADYVMDFSQLPMHVWHGFHVEVSQLTYLRGLWRIQDQSLWASGTNPCEAYTGYYFWRDIAAETTFIPHRGEKYRFLFRVQGGERCYAAALEAGRLSIEKKDGCYHPLATISLTWQEGQPVTLSIRARGDLLEAAAGDIHISCRDEGYAYGQIGWGLENGRMEILRACIQAE